MQNDIKTDLFKYAKITLSSSGIIIILLGIGLLSAKIFSYPLLTQTLCGALVGTLLSTINLFSLGYAFFIIAIKKGSPLAMAAPIICFIILCILAYVSVNYAPSYGLGFALGMTTPIIIATAIVYKGKPA